MGLSGLDLIPAANQHMQLNHIQVTYAATSLKISAQHTPPGWSVGDTVQYDDDDENGFVMGGTEGAGLEPLGAAPAAPPPPHRRRPPDRNNKASQ